MNVQEMETARRLDADVTVMVWVDGGYGLIAWKQQTECGRSTDLSFGNPDWLGLARSFGWHEQYVERSADLAPALCEALDHRGPSLIALPIDYRENLKLGERLGGLQLSLSSPRISTSQRHQRNGRCVELRLRKTDHSPAGAAAGRGVVV